MPNITTNHAITYTNWLGVGAYMLQVKFDFRLILISAKLILHFLCLLGLGDKEFENQPRLKNFNLNLILACNIYYIQFNTRIILINHDF